MRVPFIVVLLSPPAWAAQVELFPSVGTPDEVTVTGRVLEHAPATSGAALAQNLGRLTAGGWVGASVEVWWAGRAQTVSSGKSGDFTATFTASGEPFPVGPHPAEASVKDAGSDTAMVDVIAPSAPFFVVSDFDDTIAVTNVRSPGKLLKTALLQNESTQPVVEGMPAFYRCLREVSPASPAFALVSGSPTQYVGRIRSFLERHAFPPLGLYLRTLGPSTWSDYKQPFIRTLLRRLPHKVVLVGDSGEKDPEVYAQIRDEFKDRVLRIYIRNAGRATDPRRFRDMVLFNSPDEAARDAATHGLAASSCVEEAFPRFSPDAGARGPTAAGAP